MPWGSPTLAAASWSTWRNLGMVYGEDCRTAVLGKTERTVGWEGDGDPIMTGLVRHCKGKPAATDRPRLPSLSHSFTLDGALWQAFVASVRHLAGEKPLDLRIL